MDADKGSLIYPAPEGVVLAFRASDVSVMLGRGGVGCFWEGQARPIASFLTASCPSLDMSLSAIGRLRGCTLPENVKRPLMQYYCFPFCVPIIRPSDTTTRCGNVQRMQILQNAAIRFVYSLMRYHHVSPVIVWMQTCFLRIHVSAARQTA